MDTALIHRLAREAGMNTEALNCGSGSCVYTEGCNGVGQGELERFAALVAEEVMNAVRRHGSDMTNAEILAALANPNAGQD